MKENIVISIPSYQRYETIKTKTLAMLEKHNVPPSQVMVWVANEEEEKLYKESLKDCIYNNIQVGVPTIGAQRNHIERSHPERTWLTMIDDDIADLVIKTGEQTSAPVEDLMETLNMFFKETNNIGAHTWGIYPVDNPYFMKHRINTKLCYIIACFTGVIVDHDPEMARTLNHGEDQELSIRSFRKYGKVARFEEYTVKTKFFGEGGLEEFRSQDDIVETSIKKLGEMFPDYAKAYQKKNGIWDIKFKQGPQNKNQVSLF